MGQRKSHSQRRIRIRARNGTVFAISAENARVPCEAVILVPLEIMKCSHFWHLLNHNSFQPILCEGIKLHSVPQLAWGDWEGMLSTEVVIIRRDDLMCLSFLFRDDPFSLHLHHLLSSSMCDLLKGAVRRTQSELRGVGALQLVVTCAQLSAWLCQQTSLH